MKKHKLLQKIVLAGVTGLLLFPTTVSAASSYYRVDKYGELYDYKGSSNITIRANTSAISYNAFSNDKTTKFTVASGNPYFKSVNGVLYTQDGQTLVKCPSEKTGSFTIPSTVKKIAQNAFLDCSKLEHVTIPSSVTNIGKNAFDGCSKMTSVSLKANIKRIPAYCFSDCDALSSITIPNSVSRIYYNAFSDCASLKSISFPENLSIIKSSAFNGCKSLTSVTIPKKVTKIDPYTFKECTNLKTVTLHDKLELIDCDAFSECENLTYVKNTEGITYIGRSAFENCKKLCHFSFGEELETISSYAFSECNSLGNVFLPASVQNINDSAFCGAASDISVASQNEYYSSEKGLLLNKKKTTLIQIPHAKKGDLVIPKSVTQVYSYAICSTLITTLTFSDNITELSNSDIYNCPNLTTVKMPSNLQKLNSRRYKPSESLCPKLRKITISKKNPNFSSYDGVLYNKNQTKLRFYPVGKRGTLKIPKNCSNITSQITNNKLSNISVPQSNTHYKSIDGALVNYNESYILAFPCKKETYRISRYINDISYLIKHNDILSLKTVSCSQKNKKYYTEDGVIFSKKSNELLFYPTCKLGEYVIPKTTQYINNIAFTNAKYLTKLTITKNVKRYSYNVLSFYGCRALKEIKIDEGNLNSIRLRFDDETNMKLSKITFPSNIMSIQMKGLPTDVNIYGWNNTGAKSIAKKYKCNYICRGTVPEKVSNLRMKKIIDKYNLTWNPVSGVSGYQIYTKYETLGEVSGESKTSYKINSLSDINASRIYVRPYQVQNGKKVYGKANSLYIY